MTMENCCTDNLISRNKTTNFSSILPLYLGFCADNSKTIIIFSVVWLWRRLWEATAVDDIDLFLQLTIAGFLWERFLCLATLCWTLKKLRIFSFNRATASSNSRNMWNSINHRLVFRRELLCPHGDFFLMNSRPHDNSFYCSSGTMQT